MRIHAAAVGDIELLSLDPEIGILLENAVHVEAHAMRPVLIRFYAT